LPIQNLNAEIRMFRLAFLLTMLITPVAGRTDDPVWAALAQPGAIAVMRHALAPGTGDPPGFTLDNCSTQRTLDARGRAQARRIGESFRARGIIMDRVMSSEWCRCRETAALLDLGPVEALSALNSFFADRSAREAQIRESEVFLQDLPGGQRAILVTHQVNITALTGIYPASGEIVVGRMGPEGFVPVGSIRIGP
jgi:phosphohistidine phosphatase SixA